jgi:hypothetical protein
MDCTNVESWLLESEDRRRVPSNVAEHVDECATCRRMVEYLDVLEAAWRQSPPVGDAERSKQEFLARLARDEPKRVRIHPRAASTKAWPRWALAASIFLAIGLGVWLALSDRQAVASTDVLDRLVDWNLSLTEAGAADRKDAYAHDAREFRQSVANAHLRGPEAELASTLLNTAESLATSDNSLAHLNGFRDMADRLAELIDVAIERGDVKRAELLARQYRRITDQGIKLNLQRAEDSGALHLDRPGKLEKVILEDVNQAEALARLLEDSPNLSRSEIRAALGIRKEHANRKRLAPLEP